MSFIPRYVDSIPIITQRIRHLEDKYRIHHGRPFNYSDVWWTPPLEPKAAFDLESTQITTLLGLKPLISLSDHDNVDAGFALQLFEDSHGSPISSEWTIPVENTFVHIGVHNLQPARARMLEDAMERVTANPIVTEVEGLLDELGRDPKTLIVLNHPLWDEARIGYENHCSMLRRFLDRYGRYLHAVELNGLRPPPENLEVLRLSQERSLPAVSGGDRHGCEANSILNLTNAASFGDFVAEIRDGAPVYNLCMPQYDEPIRLRVLQVVSDVLRTYDEFEPGRRLWSDRILYTDEEQKVRRLSEVWVGRAPGIVGHFVSAIELFKFPMVRALLRATLAT